MGGHVDGGLEVGGVERERGEGVLGGRYILFRNDKLSHPTIAINTSKLTTSPTHLATPLTSQIHSQYDG